MPQMLLSFSRIVGLAAALFTPVFADTFGFPVQADPIAIGAIGPDAIVGEKVTIPYRIRLQSFGLMYGTPAQASATTTANVIFGLFSYRSLDPFDFTLVAVTNPIRLSAVQTYDNIPFITSPIVNPGTYWMMANSDSLATPRMSYSAEGEQIAGWPSPYASGMPKSVFFEGSNFDYTSGFNYNFWVKGRPTATALPEPGAFTELGGLVALALFLAFRHKRVESSHRPFAMKP
jgi:hypothetical protein